MATSLASRFNKLFISLLLLLVHLGCFIFTSPIPNRNNHHNYLPRRNNKRKFVNPSTSTSFRNLNPQKALSSSWSFIKRVFNNSKRACKNSIQTRPQTPTTTITTTTTSATTTSFSSPRSSQHSSVFIPIIPHPNDSSNPPRKRRSGSRSDLPTDSLCENPFLPLRNDIFPCPSCGEIFQKPNLLEHHQSTKHAVSELRDGDSGKNIVWIIFKTGWADHQRSPKIHRILKIHNSPKILSRFEEYRETVKIRASRQRGSSSHERCIADGNELLRFHCTTFVCSLGQNGNSSICSQNYCSACGIIRAGFSPKLDGISTLSSSWRAHVSIPDDVEAEFAFMNVKRAMLVCRVIAGRVGCDPLMAVHDKEDLGFDSLVGRTGPGQGKVDDDELLVFNPRAVLPCFLIVYSV